MLDLDVRDSSVAGLRYRLLPVFSNLLRPTRHGRAHREVARAYAAKLGEPLAVTEGLLYRRGNFNGTFDQVILDALMAVKAPRSRSHPASAGARAPARRDDHASKT